MSEFELIVIPVSLVLGLGVTRILSAYILVIRERHLVRAHWIPILWGFSILVLIIAYFNSIYQMDQSGEAWTWGRYGPVLLQTALIFLSAGLILPSETSTSRHDMLEDFKEHGRFALIPLGIILVTAPIANRLNDSPWIGPNNIANIILTALIVAMFLTRRGQLHTLITILFAGLMVLSALFAWAQPGD